MKKLLLLPVLVLTIFSPVSAQTLKIAHKSHAGKAATFMPGDLDWFGWVGSPVLRDTVIPDVKNPHEKNNNITPADPDITPVLMDTAIPPDNGHNLDDAPDIQVTPVPDFQPTTPVPAKNKRVKKTRKNQATGTEETFWEEVAEADVAPAPSPQLAEQRSSRMTWLYGLLGLVILPGVAFASGAFRKSPDKTA